LNSSEKTFNTTLDFMNSLPFGVCETTGHVHNGTIELEITPQDCEVINLGGGKLTSDSKFVANSRFNVNNELEQRTHETYLIMISPDGTQQAKIHYNFLTEFYEFEPRSNDWLMTNLTEVHNLEELQDLLLY